jgi:hypothetical protein
MGSRGWEDVLIKRKRFGYGERNTYLCGCAMVSVSLRRADCQLSPGETQSISPPVRAVRCGFLSDVRSNAFCLAVAAGYAVVQRQARYGSMRSKYTRALQRDIKFRYASCSLDHHDSGLVLRAGMSHHHLSRVDEADIALVSSRSRNVYSNHLTMFCDGGCRV